MDAIPLIDDADVNSVVSEALRGSTFMDVSLLFQSEAALPPTGVPSLVDHCLHCLVTMGTINDERIPWQQRKHLKRLHKAGEERRKYEKGRVVVEASPPQFVGHTMRGVPKRPFAQWVARVMGQWMKGGRLPLAFPPQGALQEVDPFPLEELVGERVAQLARDWNGLQHEERVERMRQIFCECGARGISRILNMRHTAGSQDGLLPPSHAVLLAAFNANHVKGETTVALSVGGRALAKHCRRDRTLAWWGKAEGTANLINWHAQDVILRILDNATWCNVHVLPHDVKIFEARVTEGYGARWLADGSEFRGFVEPHSEDGHDNGWLH